MPTSEVLLSAFCPAGHLCCRCLKGARSFQMLSLKVPLFFPPFYPSYNQQFLDSVCKINNPLYETAQVGSITFWFVFVSGAVLCVFLLKVRKRKLTLNSAKLLASFCILKPVSNCCRLDENTAGFAHPCTR